MCTFFSSSQFKTGVVFPAGDIAYPGWEVKFPNQTEADMGSASALCIGKSQFPSIHFETTTATANFTIHATGDSAWGERLCVGTTCYQKYRQTDEATCPNNQIITSTGYEITYNTTDPSLQILEVSIIDVGAGAPAYPPHSNAPPSGSVQVAVTVAEHNSSSLPHPKLDQLVSVRVLANCLSIS